MGGPSIEKDFTPCDTGPNLKSQSLFILSRRTPRRRTEFAKSVVFGRDALKIEQKMTFPFACASVARRKLVACGMIHQVMHVAGAKDQVARKNALACLQQSGAGFG